MGGVPLLMGVQGRAFPRRPRNLQFQWLRPHALVGTWGISLAVKPEIVGVAGANMQWGHFVCPSSSQKNTAFHLILQSKLVEVVLHAGKRAKFGVEKVNGGQNISNRVAGVGNGKCSKG